jgi:hypothetical protein
MIRDKLLQELQELSRLRALAPGFVVAMKSLSDEDLKFLAESVDDSDYSLQEWLLALDEFAYWQVGADTVYPPHFMIEYLNCCVQGSVQGGGKLVPLAELFREYARLYGVKGEM